MLFSTIFTFIAFFCSLFINVTSMPTSYHLSPAIIAKRALSGSPRSLMGRTYHANEGRSDEDFIIKKSLPSVILRDIPENTPQRRRSHRFHAFQKRKAQGTELETQVQA